MPESVPLKAQAPEAHTKETHTKIQAKEAAPAAPISLPTQSWRSLLAEQSLNVDAKPFVPGQAPPGAPASTKPSTTARPVKDGDPEWMQYLSKKFETSPPDVPNKFQTSSKGRGKGKAGGAAPAMQFDTSGGFGGGGRSAPEGGAGGGGVVIHTEAYLKLLKEGTSRKKVPTNNQTARRTQNKSKAGLAADALNMDDAVQGEALMPITTLSLAKKWTSVVSKQDETAVETVEVVEHTTQDDICIEKLLLDQDLSDPAYFSDTDQVAGKSNASMHRLHRRPQTSKLAIRTYVMQDLNFLLDQAVGMLLLRLQNFMDHQRVFTPCDAISEQRAAQHQQRRFVIGLKEVSRRTKQSKVECLIIAPDIEEDANSGGLDDRMRELLASAYQKRTPVIFALSRARLGKALGKSLHISVLGVLDSTGAQSLLQESLQRASECRQAWLARLEKK